MSHPMAKTGSVMVCDKGTATVPLVASGSASVEICGALAAALTDVSSGHEYLPVRDLHRHDEPVLANPRRQLGQPVRECLHRGRRAGLVGGRLPCAVGGTISLMSAAQATVLNLADMVVGLELAELMTRAQILAWASDAFSRQDSRFTVANSCNLFVATAYAAAGIIFPEKRKGPLGIDWAAQDSVPVVKELIESERFNDILTPPGPVEEAKIGDIILWRNTNFPLWPKDNYEHSAILTQKTGADSNGWKIIYSGSASHRIMDGEIGDITSEAKITPVARGPRKP